MGIEPTLVAWEATVLPLNYARSRLPKCRHSRLSSQRRGGYAEGTQESGGACSSSRNSANRITLNIKMTDTMKSPALV
jgi:hypothetical protein